MALARARPLSLSVPPHANLNVRDATEPSLSLNVYSAIKGPYIPATRIFLNKRGIGLSGHLCLGARSPKEESSSSGESNGDGVASVRA